MSIQQQIATAILEWFPDAEVKKVDEDNYLDIHVPAVHPKRGTHLFFNTARGGIKLGLHCRDEDFVSRALETSGLVERTSNGLRPLGNPTFEDAATALRAARDFITLLQRASGSPEALRPASRQSAPVASTSRRGKGSRPEDSAHVITVAVADAFLADSESVDLSTFTELTAEAAKRLSEAETLLLLDGLTEISDEALRAVTDSSGGISLDGLTTLSDYQADVLGSYAGPSIWLNGLTELSDEAKESLLRFEGNLYCGLVGEKPATGVHIQSVDEILASLAGNSAFADMRVIGSSANEDEDSAEEDEDAEESSEEEPDWPEEVRDCVLQGPELGMPWRVSVYAGSALLKGQRGSARFLEEKALGGDAVERLPNRVLTAKAVDAICARIRAERVVPVCIPDDLKEEFQPFHKWNKACWFIPGVLVANGMNGPMCVELQGLTIPDSDNEFQLGVNFDAVEACPKPLARAYSPDPSENAGERSPRWREWTLAYTEGRGEISIFEHQPDPNAGFHLDIAAAILEVQWPVIERTRNSPVVIHMADDPQWIPFRSLEAVVAWAMNGTR